MNNKGFTLIELLATIMLLAIITSVGTYAVINYITSSNEKSYNILVKNIKIGAQNYYEECENINIMGSKLPEEACKNLIVNNKATILFSDLLKYGYIKSSSTKDDVKIIENPKTNNSMNACTITINKNIDSNFNSWYTFETTDTTEDCPKTDEYNN